MHVTRNRSTMRNIQVYAVVFLAVVCQGTTGSLIDWFWRSTSDDTTVQVADGIPLVAIPYESMTADEKFLKEAAKLTDIQVSSPLETCQHKVVMRIQTSCSDMTEEQLAKLGVNLLNCQSAAEGRKTFPCTDEMSLKQCTTDMDADMWNAYHLMSNRARAVCYATRSTQFRALTELTVNKLMSTAHTQIEKLSALKEGQEKLEEQTTEALSSLSEGNKKLLQQQQNLRDAQSTAHQLVSSNLRELTNERALIRSGHTQLAAMAEDIRQKLELASQQLLQQSMESGTNHREVLEDLMKIQAQAQDIWDKVELSTSRIFEKQQEALDRYEQTLLKLVQINDTIFYIWNMTNQMRSDIDQKLSWITSYIGDTGEQVHRIWRSTCHIIYILVAMVIAAFLEAPFLTRLSILCIVPLNLITFVKHGTEACLDFASMTILILLITTMHYLMVGIQHVCVGKREKMGNQHSTYVQRNGHTNGISTYTATELKAAKSESLYSRLSKNIIDFSTVISYSIRNIAERCRRFIESLTSWNRDNGTLQEELSCSYLPEKKSREDLVYSFAKDMPSMSEDDTDLEVTHAMNPGHFPDDEYDYLVDADDLRQRLRRVNQSEENIGRSISRASKYASSVAGNVTPSLELPNGFCSAITRSGSRCRLRPTYGRQFCGKHKRGTSVVASVHG